MLRLLLASSLVASSLAFSISAPQFSRFSHFPLKMSEPSDTSSDVMDDDYVITVEGEDYESTPEEALVSNVLDMMPSTLGGEVSLEKRSGLALS